MGVCDEKKITLLEIKNEIGVIIFPPRLTPIHRIIDA